MIYELFQRLDSSLFFRAVGRKIGENQTAMLKIVRDDPSEGIPEILQDVKGITEFKYKKARGVYFLFLNEEIVYIGQSTKVYSRIQDHIRQGVKVFNRAFVQLIDDDMNLLAVEKHFILKFRPRYNYETSAKSCQNHEVSIEQIEWELINMQKQIDKRKPKQA